MSTTVATRADRRPVLAFLRHLGGMTLAMFVGMAVFGLLLGVVAGSAGIGLESIRRSQPELFMLGMAAAMSVTMVAWMLQRGDSRHECREMTAAMLVPVIGVLASYRAGAIGADPICPLSCVLMIPAMAVTMLLRRDAH